MEMVLPMNTGAEAVESAIKVSRKWGYDVKGVPADRASIIVAEERFHGRTTTIVASLTATGGPGEGFGPFTPGFHRRALWRRGRDRGRRSTRRRLPC
jgi:ornithine--oxo-acid transaminase